MNQLRAFFLERGIALRTGRSRLRRMMPALLAEVEQHLSPRIYRLLCLVAEEWRSVEAEIEQLDQEIEAIASQDAACQRLITVPGIGVLIATAIVAAIGNGAAFSRGREFAAWLGLIPKQCSTGGKPKLLGISKNGNEYLRRLLIHGGRSIQHRVAREHHAFGSWLTELEARANTNVVAVAMANKLARIAWVVLTHQEEYRRRTPAVESAGFGLPTVDKSVPGAGQDSSINSLRSALTGS